MSPSNGSRDPAASLTLVTASDHAYFAHLENLLTSLRHQTAPPERIVIVDVGLTEAERERLAGSGHALVRYDGRLLGGIKAHLAALEVRACLDELVSDGELILWLDADIWLQSPDYFADLRGFARDYELLVTPQMDAGYNGGRTGLRVKPGWLGIPRISGWNHDLLVEAYGRAVAYRLASHATMNGGFFLAHRQSRFWEEFRRIHRAARVRKFGVEQVALTRVFVEAGLRAAALDPAYNWGCSFTAPVLDAAGDFFRKPNPPYAALHALHLTDVAKTTRYAIRRLGGGTQDVAFFDPATVAAAIDGWAVYRRRTDAPR